MDGLWTGARLRGGLRLLRGRPHDLGPTHIQYGSAIAAHKNKDQMAACSPLQSPVPVHATPAFASSSSSGVEGSTRLRRWSVNGGGQDVPLPPLHTAPLVPTVEIPFKASGIDAAVPASSTSPSPAKRVHFDVTAMFQLGSSADAGGSVLPEDGEPPEEEAPPVAVQIEAEASPDAALVKAEAPLESDVPPEDEIALEDGGYTIYVPSTAAPVSSEDQEYAVQTEPPSAAAQESLEDAYSEISALLSGLSKLSLPSVSANIIAWVNQSLEENNGRILSQLADLIFEKANDNAAKSELYAELCHTVMEHINPDLHDDEMKDVLGEFMPGPRVFRRCLISRCEEEFDRGLGSEGESSVDATQQHMALIKFIGELFNVRMLTPSIVYECLERLLTNFEWAGEPDLYVDCLDVFLTTVRRRLADSPKARAHMDPYFSHIQTLSRGTAVSPLHRVKLQSIIDQRQGWKTTRGAHSATVGDDAIGGHVLGDMNAFLHKRVHRPTSTDSSSYEKSQSTPALETRAVEEPPPARPISESEAIARAEEDSARFFSVRDIAAAEKYFAGLPPGYQHFLVDALVEKALFSEEDASLVAVLFDRVASGNLCSAAAFEDGFAATTLHLAGIAMDMPDAFEAYVHMFKGAHLDADVDRCMRIVGMSGMGDELMPLLFGSAEPTAPLGPSPLSPASPHVSEPAMSVEPDLPVDATQVTDDEAPESVSPCTIQSDPQPLEGDNDDLYADYTESPTIPSSSSSISPSPTGVQKQPIRRQQAAEQHISTQTPSAPDLRPVEEEHVPEPPSSSPLSGSNELPLVPARIRMSQQEAHERIEQSVALLFGGPHDIDRALSVFTTVPARHHSRLVDRLVSFAIESTRADAQLVAYFFWGAAAKGLCAPAAFEGGFALTAAALEDVAAESPDAVVLFATMARGAGLHKDADWRRRVFGRLEALGWPDLMSLS